MNECWLILKLVTIGNIALSWVLAVKCSKGHKIISKMGAAKSLIPPVDWSTRPNHSLIIRHVVCSLFCVQVYVFLANPIVEIYLKKTKFQLKIMITTGGIVRLAKGINDDSYLFSFNRLRCTPHLSSSFTQSITLWKH